MGKLDALGDVALETFDGLGEEGLFLVSYASEGVGGLFGTVGLRSLVCCFSSVRDKERKLTPSSMGTEKKSAPVSLAMASPPGTPGR